MAVPTSWDHPLKLIGLLDDLGRSSKEEFDELLSESSERLAPLADPLSVDLGLHDWLAPKREEHYTMWLQWCLSQLKSDDLCELLGLTRPISALSCEREIRIQYEDEQRFGRVDLRLMEGDRTVCVIEVKTKPFADVDLEKHKNYAASRELQGAKLVFLAKSVQDSDDLRGFRFLSWRDLCMGLRRLAPDVIRDRDKGSLIGAMLLAFAAAVERNLLGLTAKGKGEWTKIPATVAYLSEVIHES